MKMIILCLTILNQLWAFNNQNVDIPLVSFAKDVANVNNINIYIDEDLKDKKIYLYVPDKIKPKELLTLFKSSIHNMNLKLSKNGNTYYISKVLESTSKPHLYKLKYSSSEDCKKILEILKLDFKYLEFSNTFLITATNKQYNQALIFLNQVDTEVKQVILKMLIYEFNDDNIKDIGVQWGTIYNDISGNLKSALNTIVIPISTNVNTLSNTDFYGAIKLLQEHKLLNVQQFPYVLAKHNSKFLFEAVKNIPYLQSTSTTQSANTSQQDSFQYKDVGLKVTGKSFIFDEHITLDLDLIIEDLTDTVQTETPSTFKRHLKSNTDVSYNDVLVLSGIKRTKSIKNDYNVPYLSNIPYLGEVFKYSSKSKEHLNISIAIEVLKDVQQSQAIGEIAK